MKKVVLISFLFICLNISNLFSIVITNPDGSKVWFNTCPPGEICPMSHTDSLFIAALQAIAGNGCSNNSADIWSLINNYIITKDSIHEIRMPFYKNASPTCIGDYVGIGNNIAYLDVASILMDDGSFCDASIMPNINRILAIDGTYFSPDTSLVCSPPAPYEVSVVFALPNLCAGAYIESLDLRTKGTFNSVNEPQLGTNLMIDNVPIYYNGQSIWADPQDNGTFDYTIIDSTRRTTINSVVGTFFWDGPLDFSLDGLQITYHIRSDAGHIVLTTDASGILLFDTINIPTFTNDLDSLANLKDVQITSPNNGQVLTYDHDQDRWINQSPPTQMTEAPTDGNIYGRQNGNWASVNSGIQDAPYDGNIYGRQNGNWTQQQQQSQTLYSANGIDGDGGQSSPFKLGGALLESTSINGYNYYPIAFNNMYSFSVNSTGSEAYSTIVNDYSNIVMLSMRPSGHLLLGQSSQQFVKPEGITLQHFYQSSPGMGNVASSITLTDGEAALYGRSSGISFQDSKSYLFLNQESDSIDFVLGKKIGSSEIVWTPRTATSAAVLGENSGITTSYTTYLIDFTGFAPGGSANYLPSLNGVSNGTTFKLRRVDNANYTVNIVSPDMNSIQDIDNSFTTGLLLGGGGSTVQYIELTAFKNGVNGYSGTDKWVVMNKY